MFFLIPLLAIGALVYASARGRAAAPAAVSAGVPSPISVLMTFVQTGREPPPEVIMCAIAEAELTGQINVRDAIVGRFIAPTVAAAQVQQISARFVPPPAPAAARMPEAPAAPAPAASTPAPVEGAPVDPRSWTNDERVVQMAIEAMQRGGGIQTFRGDDLPAPQSPAPDGYAGPAPVVSAGEFAAAQMIQHEHPSQRRRASPIPGLPVEPWLQFVGCVARESPAFEAPRHVGAFRARKERLRELGIDPRQIAGDYERQVDALEADMGDAFHHAKESGLLRAYVKKSIALPNTNGNAVGQITASGVMGVIQAAGLEGAADWLESEEDRARFPHTTAAFVRTNGVF